MLWPCHRIHLKIDFLNSFPEPHAYQKSISSSDRLRLDEIVVSQYLILKHAVDDTPSQIPKLSKIGC